MGPNPETYTSTSTDKMVNNKNWSTGMKLKWSHNRELFKKDNKRLFLRCKEEFLGIAANLDIRNSKETQQAEDMYQRVFSQTLRKKTTNTFTYSLTYLHQPLKSIPLFL